MEFKIKDLINWSKDKNINPLTGRQIKTNGPIYIKLDKYYEMIKQKPYGIYSTGPKQEDKYVFQKANHIFAGVYDGHGGGLTSEYIKQNIIKIYANIQTNSIPERLRLTYKKLEDDFNRVHHSLYSMDNSGSTACTVVITPYNVYIANTGDSRCILSEQGKAMALTKDHKPKEPDEERRIKEWGDEITFSGVYRVGGLAVSRVIGDFYIKQRYKSVIYNPDIYMIKRNKYQEFIVLATDGLYDVMTNQEITNFIHSKLKQTYDLDIIAKQLVDYSIQVKKTTDDVSVIIILF